MVTKTSLTSHYNESDEERIRIPVKLISVSMKTTSLVHYGALIVYYNAFIILYDTRSTVIKRYRRDL